MSASEPAVAGLDSPILSTVGVACEGDVAWASVSSDLVATRCALASKSAGADVIGGGYGIQRQYQILSLSRSARYYIQLGPPLEGSEWGGAASPPHSCLLLVKLS